MIKITCDLCGKDVDTTTDYEIEIPRVVGYYAMSYGVKVCAFDRVELSQTHLCKKCGNALAQKFPAIK